MALHISEREATRILFNEQQRRGSTDGLQNFARTVLGAHSEQAKRLATLAGSLGSLGELEDIEFPNDAEEFRTNVDGQTATYEGPITDANELMERIGFDPEYYRVRKGGGSAWGKVGDQKISVRAEFELREYDLYRDLDRDAFIEEMQQHAPQYDPIEYERDDGLGLLEIMVSDLHADKFAEGYSVEEAERRFLEAVTKIKDNIRGMNISEIVLVLNGDTFNWDHSHQTTAGTPQHPTQRGPKVFSAIRRVIVQAVEILRLQAPVRLLVLKGNHDYEKAAYLADSLYAWFHNADDVEVVNDPNDREYIRWGVNLIGLTHGAEENKTDLPMIMMRENDVSGAEVFEWHLGHYHTSKLDEHQGVQLRWFRTPSEAGPWGTKKGYGLNTKEIVGVVWDKHLGKVAEFPVQFLSER